MPDDGGRSAAILGVIDCGTRACLELARVESRRTIALLRQLLDLFERYGTPKVLRTDNEPACRGVEREGVGPTAAAGVALCARDGVLSGYL